MRTRLTCNCVSKLVTCFSLIVFLSSVVTGETGRSDELTIAAEGKAKLPIVISAKADETVRNSAADLSYYVERISEAAFEIVEGTGAKGIVIGVPEDRSDLPRKFEFGKGPFERDHYEIVSTNDGLYLIGATPIAVEFAVWDLLHEFGYRFYFPSPTWEIVPKQPTLRIAVDRLDQPDFYNRSGPRGGMRLSQQPWSSPAWQQWQTRNRTKSSFSLSTGHAYDGILSRHRDEFDQHPEFSPARNSKRGYGRMESTQSRSLTT